MDASQLLSAANSEALRLKRAEQEIDQAVFREVSRKRQKRFKRTVMSVHAIVSHKLYKAKSSSLENYFKESWNISRAQVYRFLDCAWVLQVFLTLYLYYHVLPVPFIRPLPACGTE
jgi:hypothetical protein